MGLSIIIMLVRRLVLLILISILVVGCLERKEAQEEVADKQLFIYYGEKASIGQIPWQVALFISDSEPAASTFCGGVILNSRWIVTAAHCFEYMENDTLRKVDYNQISVFSGSIDLKDTVTSNITEIEKLYIQPGYDASKRQNDIALLKLKTPLFVDPVGQMPISLPDFEEYEIFGQVGKTAIISGWGETDTGVDPTILRMAKVPIANLKKCRDNYYEEDALITSNMICAGFDEGDRADSCGGDSGGPLFIYTGERNILLGIISWGIGCSLTGLYGVYTDCFKQRDCIESICQECVYGEQPL